MKTYKKTNITYAYTPGNVHNVHMFTGRAASLYGGMRTVYPYIWGVWFFWLVNFVYICELNCRRVARLPCAIWRRRGWMKGRCERSVNIVNIGFSMFTGKNTNLKES